MNRLVLSSLLCLIALAGLDAGCTSSSGRPVYVIADWQVRCDTTMGMCAVPLARSVTGENAISGNQVSCIVEESADARVVSVRAGNSMIGNPFRIEISAARVPRAGGFVGGSTCYAVVTEGANRYAGACGSAVPSPTQPCQVQINFGFDEMVMSPTADVEILCDHMENETTAEQLRSVTSPLGAGMPADLRFFDCVGLSRE